ncbi:MAG: RDD family protein [Methanomicrobiales archaeon]|nr:RDD family protein [Methanomicrobiales archaeon]
MEEPVRELRLATWEARFWAWLIDIIIVGLAGTIFVDPLTGFLRLQHGMFAPFGLEWLTGSGMLLWIYWTVLEGRTGQSVGKMVMNIQLTDTEGNPAGYGKAALSNLGKAFLLVLDCLIGWIAMGGARLRLFNRISDTIVVVAGKSEPGNVRYVMDGN